MAGPVSWDEVEDAGQRDSQLSSYESFGVRVSSLGQRSG